MKKKALRKNINKSIGMAMTVMMMTGNFSAVMAYGLGGENTTNLENVASASNGKRNVMYYGDWSVWGGQGNFYPKDIPADQLTHLNFAFLDFDSNGDLVFTDKDAATGNPLGQAGVTWGDVNAGILPALQDLRAMNPNLKIGVSVGGWSKSADFPVVAADPAKRANLINNLMKFIEYTNMDFVDLDWEFPGEVRQPDLVDNKNDEGLPGSGPNDKNNFIILLEDLREALDKKEAELKKEYELSVALHPSIAKLNLGVDIERLFNVVDFANIMSYDMRGAWDDKSGHQTGLYSNPNDNLIGRGLSIDESVNYLLSQGADPSKVVIGAAYYTRGWEKVTSGPDTNNPGLFGDAAVVTKDADQTPSRGAINEAPLKSGDGGRMSGIWSYRNLDKLKAEYPGIKEYWDDTAKAPYLYDEKTGAFFTYDNVKSIEEKAKYVNEKDLGGMIAWMASNDKPTTSTKRDELTKATKEGLFGQDDLQDFEIKYADVDIDASIKPYKESWGSNGGYEISFTNKEKLEESNEVLGAVEKTAETIKLPKLYIKNNGGALTSGDYLAGTVTNKDGYTIVDLSSIYDAKNIVPGRTYTFRLKAQTAPENIDLIESIEISQRINPTGKEVNRQVIFGNKDTEIPQNTAPELRGVRNREIKVNESFDPLAGVTAYDKEDLDLTANIKVVNNVNTEVAGTYEVTYTVSDKEGLTTTKKSTVKVVEEVVEENTAPVLNGLADKTLTVGDTFDAMAGVTAYDKEDKDLTSKIKVEGNVDTNKAGAYAVEYTVEDSKGLVTTKTIIVTVKEKEVAPEADFGVGQGIKWPVQVNAPFVDMASWVTKPAYNNNGAPNVAKIAQDTGVKFFNLGFIQSAPGQIVDNKLSWGWAGLSALSEKEQHTQYEGIKKSIKEVRDLGGDVTISLGGLNGVALWEASQNEDVLFNTYKEIVDGYGLTVLDLDIEGSAQDKAKNIVNAKAIKRVQDATGVDIVLTLPVMPSGLTQVQLDVLEAYLSNGVNIKAVNLMTMCYGNGELLPGENYGTASLRAVDNTKDQLKTYYKEYANTELTDKEAYGKIGTTVSIGFEGSAHPIFTPEWSKLVVDHAIEKGLAMTSFWSMNRDAMLVDNQGVKAQYEFTNIFKKFANGDGGEVTPPEENTAPVLNGLKDITLTVGDTFNAMAGVTASDKEDEDLTSKIKVEGSVDTNKAGVYSVKYTVTDSKGLVTTKTITVTVKAKDEVSGDTFDANKIYNTGDVVIYKGHKYTAKWWTQGGVPEGNQAWEKEKVVNPDGSVAYENGAVYLGGDIVTYEGKKYKAAWWTNTIPGSDSSWVLIG